MEGGVKMNGADMIGGLDGMVRNWEGRVWLLFACPIDHADAFYDTFLFIYGLNLYCCLRWQPDTIEFHDLKNKNVLG